MLLYKNPRPNPQKALDATTYIRLQTQEDDKHLFRGYYESIGLAIAASIIASQIIPAEDATQAARSGLSIGLTCASIYLSQFICETRKTFHNLQDKFRNVADFFTDREHIKIAPMTKALLKERESFSDAISFRKHPIRNTLCSLFAISGAVSGDASLASMGISAATLCFLVDVFHTEEHANKDLNDSATKAKLALTNQVQNTLEDIRDSLDLDR